MPRNALGMIYNKLNPHFNEFGLKRGEMDIIIITIITFVIVSVV